MNNEERIAKEQLLRSSVLRGEESPWQLWYDESFSDLLSYINWRCGGDREQASEIVQDTWLTAVRQVRKFDPELGSFAAWLRGIAHNLIRNHVRRARAARQSMQSVLNELDTAPVEIPQNQSEQRERIAEILIALPERYEAVLKAKYLDGLPVNEIASNWNETPSAIESLLTRAREAFRKLYRGSADEDS